MSPETRTNVVVGAASGMGAEVARLLAGRGPLLLADRDAGGLGALAEELVGEVGTIACDITDAPAVDAFVARIGPLGALVLTAGLSPTMAPGRRIYEVNIVATARLVRLLEPAVGPGSVAVCFASMAAHMVPPSPEIDAILDDPESASFFDDLGAAGIDPDQSQFAYSLSKRGVIRLVQRRAKAWGTRGGRLLSLSPGIIDTGMGRQEAQHEPAMAQMVEASALGREAGAVEVAAVAAFLTSDAASFMTGVDVLVDGGAISALGFT